MRCWSAPSWTGTDLGALAHSQLDAYGSAEKPNRLRIAGDPVTLPTDLATPFGLVLHELATNAAKHRSLSRPGVRVTLRWSVATRNNQPTLRLSGMRAGARPSSRRRRQASEGC
jgi:two-component system, chemotaxis family, CheB/CheR fusion protein